MKVNVINNSKYELPEYKTEGSAGFDFRANIEQPHIIFPMERELIPTGLFFEVPSGYELQVRPRSGLAIKNGISVLNTPGTVDADYRGEVCVILINLSNEPFTVNPGDRIAQGVINKIEQVELNSVIELSDTERGAGGFGHTGK